jgi:hypothetical protein
VRRIQQCLGLGRAALDKKDVGQCGGGSRIARIAGQREVPAVRALRGGLVGRGFGDLGRKQDVLGLLRDDL